ncbi:interferon regulatory factor 8-like isoform X2 [Lampetra fluviatilis]
MERTAVALGGVGSAQPVVGVNDVIEDVAHSKARLRPWLLEQIESGLYPGLCWEDDSKATFRIPWKHAAKHDYSRGMHGAIFRAWAQNRGKFSIKEQAEPSAMKTRLRCALNKSTDFQEVSQRSQLDIPEPYKVYRVLPEDTGSSSGSIGADGGGGGKKKRRRMDHDYEGHAFYEKQAGVKPEGPALEIKVGVCVCRPGLWVVLRAFGVPDTRCVGWVM